MSWFVPLNWERHYAAWVCVWKLLYFSFHCES